jgi:hypothetical protein
MRKTDIHLTLVKLNRVCTSYSHLSESDCDCDEFQKDYELTFKAKYYDLVYRVVTPTFVDDIDGEIELTELITRYDFITPKSLLKD